MSSVDRSPSHMDSEQRLTDRLRSRLLGELHLGHLRPGDRLPPIRELTADLDADHRAVAQAYRRLEAEGLVELRARTGAYVAVQQRIGGEMMEETARWLAGTLMEARRRRVTVRDLPEFIRRCTASVRLCSTCLDSNEDSMVALCAEMTDDFGFDATAVLVDEGMTGRLRREKLPTEVQEAHLLVTTRFHAQQVGKIAELLGKPMIVTTLASEMVGIIERQLRDGRLTLIAVDPAFGERFRSVYGSASPAGDRIHVVLASDAQAIARLDRLEPVLVTRAARRQLPDLDLPLLLPRYPSISNESAHEITNCLIRLNLEAEQNKNGTRKP